MVVEYDPKSWIVLFFRMHGAIFPRIFPRILFFSALGIGAEFAFQEIRYNVSPTPHTILGVALGLLLVFRTNTAYDRYWEGRKLIGVIVSRSRDLSRQVSVYMTGNDEYSEIERTQVQRRIVLFFALVRQHLRQETNLDELGMQLTAEERDLLLGMSLRPAVAAVWISATFARAVQDKRLRPELLLNMDNSISLMIDALSGCERIRRTPLPFAYAHHIKGFLLLFCISLPFVLAPTMAWATPFATAIIAYGFYGIEEIGVEIEDPFGYDPNDHPLDAIGMNIARDTRSIYEAGLLEMKHITMQID